MASNLEKSGLPPAEITALEGSAEYYIDPQEDRRVLWKIDRVVMPIMMVVLFFQCKTATYCSCRSCEMLRRGRS